MKGEIRKGYSQAPGTASSCSELYLKIANGKQASGDMHPSCEEELIH